MEDERGVLIFEPVKYVEDLTEKGLPTPSAVVLENSKRILLGHRGVYKTLKRRFGEVGYKVKSNILDTKLNGIPQGRERAYIVAIKRQSWKNTLTWPQALKTTIPIKKILFRRNKKVESAPITSKFHQTQVKNVHFQI